MTDFKREKTVFELWVEKGYPMAHFTVYLSPEFEFGTTVKAVIHWYPGVKPQNPEDVSFYTSVDQRDPEPMDPNCPVYSLYVDHNRKFKYWSDL